MCSIDTFLDNLYCSDPFLFGFLAGVLVTLMFAGCIFLLFD